MTMQRTMKLYRLPEASGALGRWAGQEGGRGGPALSRKGAGQAGEGALLPGKQPNP